MDDKIGNTDILDRIAEIESQMDDILDMPEEYQTDDIWEEYAELEVELEKLENML